MNNGPALEVRVLSKTIEAVDIAGFELVSADGAPLPAFSAGSHIDVHLPGGLTRQYSLCNDPAQTHHYQIGVLRDPASRGGSQALHELVGPGDSLRISVPKNHFALVHEAQSSLLLAGGIGVTPILCMAERLHASGALFEMHYCTRSRERTAFYQRIRDSAFADRVEFHFDDAGPGFELESVLGTPVAGRHVYVCGPKGFMDAVLDLARAHGWAEAQLHYEFFAGAAPMLASEEFEVQLASSGRVILVPAGQSVIHALEAVGVTIPFSCGEGICGTCVTRVLQGTPEHRDLYLSPSEQARNDCFMPCCSRSQSPRLVLDL